MRNLIITIFLTLGIWSCGTRNVNKAQENINVTKKDTTEVSVNTGSSINTDIVENKTTEENVNFNYEEAEYSPIDPDKPMTHTGPDGKTSTYTNTKIKTGSGSGTSSKMAQEAKETKTATKDTSDVKVKSGSHESVKKQASIKTISSKGAATNIWFWIGIAVATCIVLWFLWFVIIKRKKK